MNISQTLLLLLSASAIFFLTRRDHTSKYGPILGLLSQPFWIYETFIAAQWGMFILAIIYAGSWIQGIYNFWFKKQKEIPSLSEDELHEARTQLYYWRIHNGQATNFSALIFNLLGKADHTNMKDLRKGFPAQVQVWEEWYFHLEDLKYFTEHSIPYKAG